MALTWVRITNLKGPIGPPGDAAALMELASVKALARGAHAAINDADPYLLRPADDSIYAIPFTDGSGYAAGGVQTDGVFNFAKPPRVMGAGGMTFQPVTAPGFAFLFTDRDGYVGSAITESGETVNYKGGNQPLSDASSLRAGNDALGYTRTRSDRITAIGDSLTYGHFDGSAGPTSDSWPSKLQTLLGASVRVNNLGVSGYSVDEEAIRVGAFPLPLTVAGGSIPASGPVEVTTTAVVGWVPSGTRTFAGSIAGVAGSLVRTSASDTKFTFTRTTAGQAVTVSAGTPFISATSTNSDEILIILLGRNDVSNDIVGADSSVAAHVINGVKRIVDWQSRDLKKVLVLSMTNAQNETRGTARHQTVQTINTGFASMMGPRYLDIRTPLVLDALGSLGLTSTAADRTAMAADAIPPQLMGDNVHWTRPAHDYVATLVNRYLTDRDWTK